MSNSLLPHGLQHTRLPRPSPTPGAYSNLCPLSRWCHPTISSSVVPFSSRLQSFLVSFSSESALRIRWPKYWSFSFSINPSKEYSDWFPLGWTGLISLQSKGLSRIFSNTAVQKHQFFGTQLSLVQLSHLYMTTGKTIALTKWTFVGKVMSLLCNMLSRLVIAFLPRSKHLLISWLQSPSAVILEPPQNKVSHCFHGFPIYLPWSDGTRCHGLSFLHVEF